MLLLTMSLNCIFSHQTQTSSSLRSGVTQNCVRLYFFCHRTGESHRVIKLKPIVQALGPAKTAVLPAFHALSGADNTGSFSGKGKLICWKVFEKADESVTYALADLWEATLPVNEKFVCQLYLPKTSITTVKELRWFLFRKKQAQSDRLPPTQAALYQAILRDYEMMKWERNEKAHYEMMMWKSNAVTNSEMLLSQNYGWQMDKDEWLPGKMRMLKGTMFY